MTGDGAVVVVYGRRPMKPTEHADRTWILALIITCAGFALRVSTLGRFWINADEGIYYHVANAPERIAKIVISLNVHPPLYYWLLRGIASIDSDFVWLRVPSLISGSLAIFAMYLLGRQSGGRVCGITSALILAFSPGAIMLSQVARPYMPMLLFVVLALFFLLRFISEGGTRNLWIYTALTVVALLFHYASFVIVATVLGLLAILGVTRRLDAPARTGLAMAHIPIALVMVWLYFTHIGPSLTEIPIRMEALSARMGPSFVETPLEAWRSLIGLIEYIAGSTLVGVASLAFLASLIACVVARKLVVVVLVAVALMVSIALSTLELYPFGGSRHSFHLAPLLILVVANGAGLLANRSLGASALVLIMLGVSALAPTTTERALGLARDRPRASNERKIPVAEVEELLVPLASIIQTPGLLVMDGEAAHTLAPLIEESWAGFNFRPDLPFHWFQWEKRQVVLIRSWRMEVRRTEGVSPAHLDTTLGQIPTGGPELAQAMKEDVRLLSARGSSVPRSLRALARDAGRASGPFGDPVQTRHFSIVRLDVEAYRRLLEATPPPRTPISDSPDS